MVTANVTITSLSEFKENVQELDPELLDVKLPTPKMYERKQGRKGVEIGFIAEELPEFLRRGSGYDLKALVALLAWKVTKLEDAMRKQGV